MRGIIPLIYYSGVPNVGDLANADLISVISGCDPYQTKNIDLPHLVAVGSNMEWTYPNSFIWGTGVMDPSRPLGKLETKNVSALRGKLTQSCLAAQGHRCDVPLGDPAFLLPRVLGISKTTPLVEMGIVPHYVDQNHPLVTELTQNYGVRLLDVRTLGVVEFIKSMSECGSILSSSLHGLIFAEALGIPNLWVELSSSVLGGGFKFHDWFSTCETPQKTSYTPNSVGLYNELYAKCRIHDCSIMHKQLIDCFPCSAANYSGAHSLHPHSLKSYTACRAEGMVLFVDNRLSAERSELIMTIDSAAKKWHTLSAYVVGGANNLTYVSGHSNLKVHHVFEPLGITDKFMKDFWDAWAEPQQYVIAEPGFDFTHLDIEQDINLAFVGRPDLETIAFSVANRKAIHRRAGRWW